MNRTTTALLAALEALIVVAIGVGIALVPLTILWATHFDLAVDWFVFWRAAVDVWLLGNGVDLAVQLDPATVTALGLPDAGTPFTLTIALLGFALLGTLFGVRTGIRSAETPHRQTGVIVSILTYASLSAVLTVSAGTDVVRPAAVQGILLPTCAYAVGVLIGAELGRARHADNGGGDGFDALARAVRSRYRMLPQAYREVAAAAVRGGTAAVACIVGVSAIAVAVLVLVGFATVIGLYETLQAGPMGGVAITLAQLALIPNLVVWAASWFVGPGIAVGVGTSVTPVGTVLGPLPGLPILGALPKGDLAFGFLGLVLPVLAGFLCALMIRQRMRGTTSALSVRVAAGAGMGLVAGVLIGVLAWWSAGSMGPGRLAVVGPHPLLVGLLASVEVGMAAVLAMTLRPDPAARSLVGRIVGLLGGRGTSALR